MIAVMNYVAALGLIVWMLCAQVPDKVYTLEDFSWDKNRDAVQNTKGILEALKISPGDWVADVGAGAGYHAGLMSEMVGPHGKVFAENIEDVAIAYVNARIKLFDLKNIESVRGDFDNPKLPLGALAGVLVVDTYHHFTAPDAMLAKIFETLKPGGRLVIADYSVAAHRQLSRAAQLKQHELDPALVRTDAEKAGFEVVKMEDPFFVWQTAVGNTRTTPSDLWLLTLRRP